jgi:hypothetical protein
LGITSPTDTMKHTCDSLRQEATKQVADYERRFSSLKSLYESLLSNLIRTGFSSEEAHKTALEFFGSPSARFAGIDGTMYSRPLFDMVIFFGGAYASTGVVTFSETAVPSIDYDARTIQQGTGISSVVPIYVNEIPDVDQTFSAPGQSEELNPSKQLTDEAIVDNSIIANSIMTFSEYYLAYKLATKQDQKTQIILLDRCLSSERASLLYDTSKNDLWRNKSAILGLKVEGTSIDENDLSIGRHSISNPASGLPPPRADYLRYGIIDLVKRQKSLSLAQILNHYSIRDEKRAKRVESVLRNLSKKGIITRHGEAYALNQRYISSWNRLEKLTVGLGDGLFFPKQEDSKAAGPMKITKDGKEHWLTTLDIGFLTLFTMQMLMYECWKNRILLIGITKDTAARDFKRQLIPIMYKEGSLRNQIQLQDLQDLPNTDRMILQSASIFNSEKVAPPWSLIEYDSAFKTMLPDRQNRKGYVSGAIKNKISLEKTFVKTYVQLSQAKTDPLLRSNVLLIDRLAHAEYDCTPENTAKFWNELADGTAEPVETVLYKDKTVPNKLQNLIMIMLVAMAPLDIPEAFGHNKPLFIADKVAKWNYNQSKSAVDTTASWILNNHKLRRFIFYMSTFRERRASFEAARRENL